MRYTYDSYAGDGTRLNTTTSFEEVEKEIEAGKCVCIRVTDNLLKTEKNLWTMELVEEWRASLERSVWNPCANLLDDHVKKEASVEQSSCASKAVDPSHYKNYIDEMQWLDAMSKIPTLREPDVFIGALELQVRKYLDRRGGKDDDYQELGKALVYLEYMRQFIGFAYHGKDRPTVASVQAKLKD